VGNLFERVPDRDNLRLAFAKAMRGKRDRADVRLFAANLEDNLKNMAGELRAGVYPVGRYSQFVIHDPKKRIITAPCFAERVLHHAVMNICEPALERWLIHDTFACRAGRGQSAALSRAGQFAARFTFYLTFDIRKYFDSISHEILLSCLERLFKDRRLLDLLYRVVHGFRGCAGRGLPIGSLTSQHLANFYLGWLDRHVKETLRVKGYVRYMNDMALWADSPVVLEDALASSREYLGDHLRLEIKQYPCANRTPHGMSFLGCRVFRDRITLNRQSRLRFRRKLVRLEQQFLAGEIHDLDLQQRAASLIAFTRSGSVKSWHLRRSVLQKLPVSGQRPPTG
jgi:retron-type reverse transcriptase